MSTNRVRVRAFPERGFFRAGRYWPPTATEAEVTEAELKQLQAEPKLAVEVLDDPASAKAKGK